MEGFLGMRKGLLRRSGEATTEVLSVFRSALPRERRAEGSNAMHPSRIRSSTSMRLASSGTIRKGKDTIIFSGKSEGEQLRPLRPLLFHLRLSAVARQRKQGSITSSLDAKVVAGRFRQPADTLHWLRLSSLCQRLATSVTKIESCRRCHLVP